MCGGGLNFICMKIVRVIVWRRFKSHNFVEEGSNLICMKRLGVIAFEIFEFHMYEKSRGNCVEEGYILYV